jgi:glycine cleavage system H protein
MSGGEEARTYPEELKYSKEHEWILVEGDRGRVGITDHAQAQLGDVIYVELPKVGTELRAGEVFGTIESVKAVSELYSPVSGKVLEANAELENKPELANEDPHGKAWMMVLRIQDPAELRGLLSATEYRAHVEKESAD